MWRQRTVPCLLGGFYMKRKALIVIFTLICVILLATLMVHLINRNIYLKNCTEIHLHSTYCEYLFDLTPEEFCKSEGKGTILENGYSSVKVDEAGFLCLKLSDVEIKKWRNSQYDVRVLQAVLGESRDIGVSVTLEGNPLADLFIEHADNCGYEISEDFKQIIISFDDDVSYIAIIVSACLFMQVTDGTPSDEANVEYVRFDENGKEISRETISLNSATQ